MEYMPLKSCYRKTLKSYRPKGWKAKLPGKLITISYARVSQRMRLLKIAKKEAFTGYVGCTKEEFKAFIEAQFTNGMTWENYGINGWHIDHIKPLSSFDLTNVDQVKIACHYTNLQPLWCTDNLRKSNKLL